MARIKREKKTIDAMVKIYCHDHHRSSANPCTDCLELQDYAHRRLDICPFQDEKPACNKCTVHCYATTMRERVREIMRYSGPRMLFRYPLLSLMHMVDLIRRAPQLKKNR